MPLNESEHVPIVHACRRAANAKESPMTLKRLMELIEEEKVRYRSKQQASSVRQAKEGPTKEPHQTQTKRSG